MKSCLTLFAISKNLMNQSLCNPEFQLCPGISNSLGTVTLNTAEIQATDVIKTKRKSKAFLFTVSSYQSIERSFVVDGIFPSHTASKIFNQVSNYKQLTKYDKDIN